MGVWFSGGFSWLFYFLLFDCLLFVYWLLLSDFLYWFGVLVVSCVCVGDFVGLWNCD